MAGRSRSCGMATSSTLTWCNAPSTCSSPTKRSQQGRRPGKPTRRKRNSPKVTPVFYLSTRIRLAWHTRALWLGCARASGNECRYMVPHGGCLYIFSEFVGGELRDSRSCNKKCWDKTMPANLCLTRQAVEGLHSVLEVVVVVIKKLTIVIICVKQIVVFGKVAPFFRDFGI